MTCVREAPMQGNLNDIFEVELNFIGRQRIEESIEWLLQFDFEIFESCDDLVYGRLVQQTARSVNEKTKVFVKLDIRRKLHRVHHDFHASFQLTYLPPGAIANRSIGAPSHCAASLRSWNTRALIEE